MKLETLNIDEITPYWRNPRVISQHHIDAVKESIDRFGYQSPIMVDKDHVVIVGHTRLQALRALGYTEIPVIIADLDPKKVKEYRLIDNRTAEQGEWDNEKLFLELREFTEMSLAQTYFPEISLEIKRDHINLEIDSKDLLKATDKLHNITGSQQEPNRQVVCPHCYEEFSISN